MSRSISRCSVSSHSVWIIGGLVRLRYFLHNIILHWTNLISPLLALQTSQTPSSTSPTFPQTDKSRAKTPHDPSTYTFANYLDYVLYPPLYIAGPIMGFNDWMWQVRFRVYVSFLWRGEGFAVDVHGMVWFGLGCRVGCRFECQRETRMHIGEHTLLWIVVLVVLSSFSLGTVTCRCPWSVEAQLSTARVRVNL